MRTLLFACLSLIALGGTPAALSHHSTANFDNTKKITVTGKVVFFRLTNPHSHIDIEVQVEGAAPRSYKIFTVAATVMKRSNWTREDLKPGDQVTLTGNPDRTDPTLMYLTQITFANGRTWNWDSIQ